jgi:hypothetical protein
MEERKFEEDREAIVRKRPQHNRILEEKVGEE